MKTILISVGAVVVVGLLVFASWYANRSGVSQTETGASTNQGVGLPIAPSVTPTTSTSSQDVGMTIAGINGAVMQVNNFLADSGTVQDTYNTNYYYLGYHTEIGQVAANAPPYVITYIRDTQYFNIALLQEPIGPVREEMQQYLMEQLGLTQDQMCLLNYMVTVPDRVNATYSGQSLGFSFCPGAVRLPK